MRYIDCYGDQQFLDWCNNYFRMLELRKAAGWAFIPLWGWRSPDGMTEEEWVECGRPFPEDDDFAAWFNTVYHYDACDEGVEAITYPLTNTDHDFNVVELAVSHTYYYSAEDYLSFCKDSEIEPSEQGFVDFVLPEINDDFPRSDWHPTRLIHKDAPEIRHPDDDALDSITRILSGSEWNTDTIDAIAEIVRRTGRPIANIQSAPAQAGE